jgi:hypothetical protein
VTQYLEELLKKYQNQPEKNTKKINDCIVNPNLSTIKNHKNDYMNAINEHNHPIIVDYAYIAARECERLVGNDIVLWERWYVIYIYIYMYTIPMYIYTAYAS